MTTRTPDDQGKQARAIGPWCPEHPLCVREEWHDSPHWTTPDGGNRWIRDDRGQPVILT